MSGNPFCSGYPSRGHWVLDFLPFSLLPLKLHTLVHALTNSIYGFALFLFYSSVRGRTQPLKDFMINLPNTVQSNQPCNPISLLNLLWFSSVWLNLYTRNYIITISFFALIYFLFLKVIVFLFLVFFKYLLVPLNYYFSNFSLYFVYL